MFSPTDYGNQLVKDNTSVGDWKKNLWAKFMEKVHDVLDMKSIILSKSTQ